MKKGLCSLVLLGLVLTSCTNPSTSTTTDGNSSDSSSNTNTSVKHEVDLDKVYQKLIASPLAVTQSLVYQEISAIDSNTIEFEVVTTVDTFISDSEYYYTEYDETTIYYLDHYFKDENGFLSTKELQKDNTVLVDSTKDKFDELVINPFVLISREDLTVVGDEVVLQSEDLEMMFSLVSGYDFEFEKMVITVDKDDNPTGYLVTSKLDDSYASEGVLIKNVLTGTFTSKEELSVPVIEPGTLTEDHQHLKEAFDLLKTNNYTLHYHDVDFDGDVTMDANIVVTDSAVLVAAGEQEYGYLDTEKGLVKFAVDKTGDNPVMKGTTIADSDKSVVDDILTPFDFAPEVFTYVGDGKFTLPLSYSLYDSIPTTLPDTFLGDNTSLIVPGAFYVILNGNGTIEFNYMWEIIGLGYGGYTQVIASNFNSSVFPYDPETQYEEKVPTTWLEYSPDFSKTLQGLIGDDNKVPFYMPDMGIMDVGFEENDGVYAYVTYGQLTPEATTSVKETYVGMLLAAGYEYKGVGEFTGDSYYLGTDLEVEILAEPGFIMLCIRSRKVYVMPEKITWADHDSKYGKSVKTTLDEIIGNNELIPCYDFEKYYHYSASGDGKTHMLMVQQYTGDFDERGYVEAFKNDLIALGYSSSVSGDKEIFTYKDQFTVSVDISNRYCTITIKLL